MKTSKTKIAKLILALVTVVALAFGATAFAADTTVDKTLVSNGYFVTTTGTATLKTPSNWTGAAGSTGTGNSAPSGSANVVGGVLDTSDFGKVASDVGALANPGKANADSADSNVLVIYNKNATAYRYRSTSFTVPKSGYVEVSVSVYTKLDESSPAGAWIVITDGNAPYAKIENIDTNGTWKTYTFLIKGYDVSTKSVRIDLQLGWGGADNADTHAKGYAYFDNVTAYTVEKTAEDFASFSETDSAKKLDLTYPNLDFERAYYSNGKLYASDWTSKTIGSTTKTVEGTSLTVSRGVSKATESFGTDPDTFTPGKKGTDDNVLRIYNPFKTAIGYSSASVFVKANSCYKISTWVKTVNVDGTGASILLNDIDGAQFEGITDTDWAQYSFYVKGSATMNKSVTIQLWLGYGKDGDTTDYTSGYAFFDNITVTEIEENELITVSTESEILVDSLYQPNSISGTISDGALAFGDIEYAERHGSPCTSGVNQITDVISVENANETYGITTALGKIDRSVADTKAAMLYNKDKGATSITLDQSFDIIPNSNYKLSFWVLTKDIKEGKGVTASLLDTTDTEPAVIKTLSSINTQKFEDGEAKSNEWTEIVFYVQGHLTDSKKISVKLTLGSGNAEDTSSYLTGYVFANNFYLEKLSRTEYSSATTDTLVAKYTFYSSTSTSTTVYNAGFDNFSPADSKLTDGVLANEPGVPEYWTTLSSKSDDTIAGITNSTVFANVGATEVTLPTQFPYDVATPAIFNGEPNLLMIHNKADAYFGYESYSISLSANTYYRLSVQVKTENVLRAGATDNAFAYVVLYLNTNEQWKIPVNTNSETTNNGWVTVNFYIATGFTSQSAKLQLRLGNVDYTVSGTAYFDNAVLSSDSTEEEFKEKLADTSDAYTKAISLITDTFYTNNTTYPATPTNYTGDVGGDDDHSAPSGTNNTVAGIVDVNNAETLGTYFETEDLSALISYYDNAEKFTGPYFLMIDNVQPTAYSYTSTSKTFAASKYYHVSFKALTKDIESGKSAKVTLALGKKDEEKATLEINSGNATGDWKTYDFYVSTASSSASATLTFALGEFISESDTSGYVSGVLGIDDVLFESVDSIPETLAESQKKITLVDPEVDDDDDDPTGGGDITGGPDAGEIFTIISYSLLGVVVVVVIVLLVIKKLVPGIKAKKSKKFERPAYDRKNVKSDEENK